MNKPIYGSKNIQITSQNLRILPSTSELGSKNVIENLKKQISLLKLRLERRNFKVSKVAEA